MRNKTTATLLALFLGGVGGHKFYLGKTREGVFFILLVWTLIPAFIAIYDMIVLLSMSQKTFDQKYNSGVSSEEAGKSNLDELEKLGSLLEKGFVTQEEFDVKKAKLL
jgi:TM2 domain-containing membrane protein YozV